MERFTSCENIVHINVTNLLNFFLLWLWLFIKHLQSTGSGRNYEYYNKPAASLIETNATQSAKVWFLLCVHQHELYINKSKKNMQTSLNCSFINNLSHLLSTCAKDFFPFWWDNSVNAWKLCFKKNQGNFLLKQNWLEWSS